jgi:hypothetical protein
MDERVIKDAMLSQWNAMAGQKWCLGSLLQSPSEVLETMHLGFPDLDAKHTPLFAVIDVEQQMIQPLH